MDKLTREAHEHSKILESIVFFEKFLKTITSDDAESYTARLHQFTDEYIVQHFKFEEQEIFPIILQQGSPAERKFIEELQEDHKRILVALAEFKAVISPYDSQPNKEQVKTIIKSSEGLINQILVHARKEDTRLFPVLKKYTI
ncbi:MAG: hemerythrin domain-containing protein [Candidatus Electrothrix sp. GW3-4]|uniref:hemerythrin domain-containing protein n=1 Tax=Candidatus Electrothrix sp. GW3-4 TaxID=3126740 RepID=UPI0030D3F6EB